MRPPRIRAIAGRWFTPAPGLACILALLMILLPLCSAQHCNHSCCPEQTQHCQAFDAGAALCAHTPEVLPETTLSGIVAIQGPVDSNEQLHVTNVKVMTKAPPGLHPDGPATVPLRI